MGFSGYFLFLKNTKKQKKPLKNTKPYLKNTKTLKKTLTKEQSLLPLKARKYFIIIPLKH